MLSSTLEGFQPKGGSLWVFRCPSCGDSRNTRHKHCYAFNAGGHVRVYCHKCGWSVNFNQFLRTVNPQLHDEYMLERLSVDRPQRQQSSMEDLEEFASQAPRPVADPLRGLDRVSELPTGHPAVELCSSRMIPPDRWTRLYHARDFTGWANTLYPGKYEDAKPEPRLVIPFHVGGELIGFQGRSYDPHPNVKYLTVCLDKSKPFMYGLDDVDESKTVVAVEGPIDSMFLVNAVASCGGSIVREVERAGLNPQNVIVAYDNEPRSPHTVKKMYKAVELGYKVLVWPERVLGDKDFNDLTLSGWTTSSVMSMIRDRSFSDLQARLEIDSWKRCEVAKRD